MADTTQLEEIQNYAKNIGEHDLSTNLAKFWDLVKEVWQEGLMGIDIGQLLTALGIFLIFMVLRGLFAQFVLNRLHGLAKRTKNGLDDKIIESLAPPIRFIPVLIGLFFAFEYISINEDVDYFGHQVIKSLVAFTLFWGFFQALGPLSYMSTRLERLFTPMMVQWLFKAARIGIVFLGGAVILEIWGIQVGPLLAGLGIFGVAVALGAQDFFKNLIAGMTIIAEKRFDVGDWIRVEGVVEGIVEEIGFRSTAFRRFDKAPVHVPNAQLSDVALINFSRMTHRRIYMVIGVLYSTRVDQLKIIRDEILKYLEENEAFDKDVSTFVRVDSFNASSIDIMIYCFTKTTVWGEWLDIKEQFAFAIKDIVEQKAGTSFAFPSTSLYVESLPEDQPEVFTPPESNKNAKNAPKIGRASQSKSKKDVTPTQTNSSDGEDGGEEGV